MTKLTRVAKLGVLDSTFVYKMAVSGSVLEDFCSKYLIDHDLTATQLQDIYSDIRCGSLSLPQVLNPPLILN